MDPKITAVDAANALGITTQAISKRLKQKELQYKKSQNRVYFGHSTSKVIFSSAISKPLPYQVITFEIVKGGPGKSSLLASTAVRASLYGLKVLCIDLDPQGNLTQAFGVNPSSLPIMIDSISENIATNDCIINVVDGLDLLPSRIENSTLDSLLMLKRLPLDRVYKDKINKLRENYDCIFIDCPPSLGQSVAAAAIASDLVIAPVAPESFCLSGLKITIDEIENLEKNYNINIPVKIIINKYDNRTKLSQQTLTYLVQDPQFHNKMFECYIRHSQDFPNAASDSISIFDAIKSTPAKEDIDIFTKELISLTINANEDSGVELATKKSSLKPETLT